MTDNYASEFARKGGRARAEKMTAEERSASARKAVEARWAKQKELVADITERSKALLKLAKANARKAKARRSKQKQEKVSK